MAESDLNGTNATIIAHYGGLDVVAAETAGLAHDLGHPPFGHGGEVALNRLLRRKNVVDGFEGNAQTFRIVAHLDQLKTDSLFGLDLTNATLASILKYPWLCPPDDRKGGANEAKRAIIPPKFGAYLADEKVFDKVRNLIPVGQDGVLRQTLEAAIMDLADDVSYATHDLEDFYKERLIDFAAVKRDIEVALRTPMPRLNEGVPADDPNAFLRIGEKLGHAYEGFFSWRAYLDALNFASSLIFVRYPLDTEFDNSSAAMSTANELVGELMRTVFSGLALTIEPKWKNGPGVVLDPQAWHLIQVLKTITRRYVVGTTRMGIVDRAQSVIVASLFAGIVKWLRTEPEAAQLPQPLASFLEEAGGVKEELTPSHYRAIADYMCTLSDSECLVRAKWLSGHEVPAFVHAR